jgi:hypothetical protein
MGRKVHNQKQRSAAMRQVAERLHMEFSEKDEWGLLAFLKGFELFQKGIGRRITNLMSKSTGLLEEKIHLFDYQYTISTGKSSRTYRQSVFFVQSKNLGLPEMLLKPEHFFHKIGNLLGMQDIDFEEWPEFSNEFLVQGEEWRIRRTISEELTRFFLVEKDWCLETVGYFLIFYRSDKIVAPKDLDQLFSKGMSLYEHLKG